MPMNRFCIFLVCIAACACQACGHKAETQPQASPAPTASSASSITPAEFSADSAMVFIQEQVDMGPRVPGTAAHQRCADYLALQLQRFGADVMQQEVVARRYDGQPVGIRNIIGSYNPDAKPRIMLCAHWDSRPWADQDENPRNHRTPIPGANDGASGAGVLLEIARQLHATQTSLGIDLIFFDAEDMGTPQFDDSHPHDETTWCLGSQHWSHAPHRFNYRAQYAILLDMVGAKDARFPREYFSTHFAASTVEKVWKTGQRLGYDQYFIDQESSPLTDDHYFINTIANIPCIDIVHYNPDTPTGFGSYWHTLNDNMDNIDRQTLQAVGTTVLTSILN